MLRAVYRALWWLVAPLAVARLFLRSRKERGYREHIGERFGCGPGRAPDDHAPLIWVHAVSVGETRAAQPLIDALMKARPDARILLTHMTPSGRATGEQIFGDRVLRCYLPYDMPGAVRRAMAQNMARAQSEVAAATVIDDADIHAWPPQTDVTIRLIRALVAGCRAEPGLNVWYEGQTGRRHVVEKIDVGIAVDLPDGLFVPVLRDVAHRDAANLRAGLDRMREDIRARRIPPEELRGNTITLSNFGMIAGKYAAPIVVPPTVAILGAGRIHDSVVAVGGVAAVHRILPLSLTFDHRVVTGGEAARFLAAVIADLQTAE